MQQLVVRVPQQQKVIFEQLAQQQQQTVSALVRYALDEYLEKNMTKKSTNHLLELAKISQGTSGPEDLSSSYKLQLYRNNK
jgi:hypothetical protein